MLNVNLVAPFFLIAATAGAVASADDNNENTVWSSRSSVLLAVAFNLQMKA